MTNILLSVDMAQLPEVMGLLTFTENHFAIAKASKLLTETSFCSFYTHFQV